MFDRYPSDGKIYTAAPVDSELASGWVRPGPSFDNWARITGVDSTAFNRAWQRPAYPSGLNILNNGVFLANSDTWHAASFTETVEKILWYNMNRDEDSRFMVLGTQYPFMVAAFPGKSEPFAREDLTWNMYTDFFPGERAAYRWRRDLSDTCVYHYTGGKKPWNTEGGGKPFDEWREMAATLSL